jgi:hypothetical protein
VRSRRIENAAQLIDLVRGGRVGHTHAEIGAQRKDAIEASSSPAVELAGPRLRMERKPPLGFDDAKSSERPCGCNGRSGPVIEGNALVRSVAERRLQGDLLRRSSGWPQEPTGESRHATEAVNTACRLVVIEREETLPVAGRCRGFRLRRPESGCTSGPRGARRS